MASLPFDDREKVVALLEKLSIFNPVLIILLSAGCLHHRFFQ
jgi:hypothetical protein